MREGDTCADRDARVAAPVNGGRTKSGFAASNAEHVDGRTGLLRRSHAIL